MGLIHETRAERVIRKIVHAKCCFQFNGTGYDTKSLNKTFELSVHQGILKKQSITVSTKKKKKAA